MCYEESIKRDIEQGNDLPKKLDIGTIKYFWLASPLVAGKKNSIPKFLRNLDILRNFSDHELKILSSYLHLRSFEKGEIIFKQNDLGIGFYFIYSGHLDVVIEDEDSPDKDATKYVLSLERRDYFGELALLQEKSVRSATIISKDNSQLLGFFKPDLEELIKFHPVIATKMLQTVASIVTTRLYSITKEVASMKLKINQLEKMNERFENTEK